MVDFCSGMVIDDILQKSMSSAVSFQCNSAHHIPGIAFK